MLPIEQDDEKYLGQEFNSVEQEDITPQNQFENMQEMANAPFGPNLEVSKEQYAQQLAELEEAEKNNDSNEPERPEVLNSIKTKGSPLKNSKSQHLEDTPPHNMVFHDFDYVNPSNKLPVGGLSINYQKVMKMGETSTRSY